MFQPYYSLRLPARQCLKADLFGLQTARFRPCVHCLFPPDAATKTSRCGNSAACKTCSEKRVVFSEQFLPFSPYISEQLSIAKVCAERLLSPSPPAREPIIYIYEMFLLPIQGVEWLEHRHPGRCPGLSGRLGFQPASVAPSVAGGVAPKKEPRCAEAARQ